MDCRPRLRSIGHASKGFTLLELLVSIVIFVLMMVPAYGWMNNLLNQTQYTKEKAQRLADLQTAYRILERDLTQMVQRKVRNEFGDTAGALSGGSDFDGVEFTRGGYPNPAGFLRSELQRIAYVPDQDQLLRRTWRVLDRSQDSLPDEQVLITDMQRFGIRFLGESDEWQERWPPQLNNQQQGDAGLPRAVEVTVELKDLGELTWLFRMSEAFIPTLTQVDQVLEDGDEGEGQSDEDRESPEEDT